MRMIEWPWQYKDPRNEKPRCRVCGRFAGKDDHVDGDYYCDRCWDCFSEATREYLLSGGHIEREQLLKICKRHNWVPFWKRQVEHSAEKSHA